MESTAVKEFFDALMSVQAELPNISKTKEARVLTKNGGTYVYKYVDLATLLKAIMPVLHKHGFVFMHYPEFQDDDVSVRTVLLHKSGHKEEVTVRLRRGVTPQETGSAITYARRYGIQCLLGIAADEDDDTQALTVNVLSDELSRVEMMLDEAEELDPGVRDKFMKHFRIKSIDELSGDKLRLAQRLLEAKLATLRRQG